VGGTRRESAQGESVADRYEMWLHGPIRDDGPILFDHHDHDMFTLIDLPLIEIIGIGENRNDSEYFDSNNSIQCYSSWNFAVRSRRTSEQGLLRLARNRH
jgi:hypothetical protein